MGSRVAAHGRVPAHGRVAAAHGRGHGRVTFEGVAACWRMAIPRHMAVTAGLAAAVSTDADSDDCKAWHSLRLRCNFI